MNIFSLQKAFSLESYEIFQVQSHPNPFSQKPPVGYFESSLSQYVVTVSVIKKFLIIQDKTSLVWATQEATVI